MKTIFRRIIFSTFLLIFIVAGPILALYVQGYRLDLQNKKITQTGGIFVKTTPKQAGVYLNGKLYKKTDFLFGSTLIENLLPQKYSVQIKKAGFRTWEKSLQIEEKRVTELKSVFLFPENVNFVPISQQVLDLWWLPDKKTMILKENKEEIWALKLYNLDNNLKLQILREDDISSKGTELLDLQFSPDDKKIILKIGTKEQIKYFSLDIEQASPILQEIKTDTIENPIPVENILAFKRVNNNYYYIDAFGNLYKTDLLFSIKEKLNRESFEVKKETEYKLHVFADFLFVEEEENLYLLNQDTKIFENFFYNVKDIKVSPDLRKTAFFTDNELWILYLKEQKSEPIKMVGEKTFLIRLSDIIQDVSWINSDHLVFSTHEDIKIIEIDDRDRINTLTLAQFENPKIFWNDSNQKLYVLEKGDLFASEKILP
jgi:hypothetical protein